jgi:hypothetical protein
VTGNTWLIQPARLDWRTGRITRYRKRKSRCHDLPGNIDNLKYRMELWERIPALRRQTRYTRLRGDQWQKRLAPSQSLSRVSLIVPISPRPSQTVPSHLVRICPQLSQTVRFCPILSWGNNFCHHSLEPLFVLTFRLRIHGVRSGKQNGD